MDEKFELQNHEVKEIQKDLGFRNEDLAHLFGVGITSIKKWRRKGCAGPEARLFAIMVHAKYKHQQKWIPAYLLHLSGPM